MDSSWFYIHKHHGKKFTKIQALEKGQIMVSIHICPNWPNPVFLVKKAFSEDKRINYSTKLLNILLKLSFPHLV